ncbi:molybdopterin-synthase adenylyltransferase MoeB [Aquimarina sp. 2-A2]|uniref:molybdopterin-synthase adenylyltransferase MoeB n=1 Tax=Aquimarina sp. 2-A2 TaxID=3382644 RepID=UPI00387EE8D2
MSRYSRHIILEEIGVSGQKKIHAAKVLIVGAGGLGCPILQYLVAAGIGTIGIVDHDIVEESNLQRQVLFGMSYLGKNKAMAAREMLLNLNPTIKINTYPTKLISENVRDIFTTYDIIVDATDNFSTRYLINDAAVILNKPVIYGAIYKFEGQVTVFNYKNGPSYRCLFPYPAQKGLVSNCEEIGVLGILPGIIGTLQANEVLKIVLGIGEPLSGKLFCYNALTNQSTTIKVARIKETIRLVKQRGEDFEIFDEVSNCNITLNQICVEDIQDDDDIQYIDVRGLAELPRFFHKNLVKISLHELTDNLQMISKDKKVIVFCKTGQRSNQAISLLRKNNITNCWSLKGGVSALTNLKLIKRTE